MPARPLLPHAYDDGGRDGLCFPVSRTGDCAIRALAVVLREREGWLPSAAYARALVAMLAYERDCKENDGEAIDEAHRAEGLFPQGSGAWQDAYAHFGYTPIVLGGLDQCWCKTARLCRDACVLVECQLHVTALMRGTIHDTHNPTVRSNPPTLVWMHRHEAGRIEARLAARRARRARRA